MHRVPPWDKMRITPEKLKQTDRAASSRKARRLMAISALSKAGVHLIERFEPSVAKLEYRYANNKLIRDDANVSATSLWNGAAISTDPEVTASNAPAICMSSISAWRSRRVCIAFCRDRDTDLKDLWGDLIGRASARLADVKRGFRQRHGPLTDQISPGFLRSRDVICLRPEVLEAEGFLRFVRPRYRLVASARGPRCRMQSRKSSFRDHPDEPTLPSSPPSTAC
jgi:hypothetical protein